MNNPSMKIFIPAGILLVLSAIYVYTLQPKLTAPSSDNQVGNERTSNQEESNLSSAPTVDEFSARVEADLAKDLEADVEALEADDTAAYAEVVGAESL